MVNSLVKENLPDYVHTRIPYEHQHDYLETSIEQREGQTFIMNLTLIITIIQEKSLHEPMYIFICNLSINSLYGSAGFYPMFLNVQLVPVNARNAMAVQFLVIPPLFNPIIYGLNIKKIQV
ncbi:uncharacterized protein FYW47_005342 [Aplochiton taeniatus]